MNVLDLRVCHQMMPALMHKYPNVWSFQWNNYLFRFLGSHNIIPSSSSCVDNVTSRFGHLLLQQICQFSECLPSISSHLLLGITVSFSIYSRRRGISKVQNYINFRFAHAYNRDWTKSANYARLLYKESKWSRCVYTYLVKWSCSHSNFLFLIYYVRGLQMCIFFAADTSVEENKRKETIAALARLEKSWKTSNKWIFRKVDTCRMRIAGKSIPIEKFCAKRAKRFLSTGSLLFAHYARISATSSFHYEAFRSLSISGTGLTLSARTQIW